MKIKSLLVLVLIIVLSINFISLASENLFDSDLSGHKTVYLTFDDGPDYTITDDGEAYSITSDIVDILDQYNVKGNFFLVGKNVEDYPVGRGSRASRAGVAARMDYLLLLYSHLDPSIIL